MLASVFDRRANGLNLFRLLLATGVIIWHSIRLTGHDIGFAPLRQLVADTWVDGFFAISGYLITESWIRRPQLRSFLWARVLRLLPGFYVCLLFTSFVLVPVVNRLVGHPTTLAESADFVRANGLLWVNRYDIGGTPLDVPFPHVWNGSTWTLAWEGLCYLGVAALGVARLLPRRWLPAGLFLAATAGSVLASAGLVHNWYFVTGSRFGVMFLAGMVVQRYADRIPVRGRLQLAAAVVVVASLWLPDYRIVAALPLAYLLISGAALVRSPRLRLRNDISYGVYVYAFPVQQSLAAFGLWQLPVAVFALLSVIATVPFAAGSWFGVERWALKLKTRPRRTARATVSAG